MKKRFLSLLLAMIMAVSLFPTAAFAANEGTEPVLLGSLADYQTTLDTVYDENGFSKAKISYTVTGGALGEKWGIMNQYGNWVAQPIYDKIELKAADNRLRGPSGLRTPTAAMVFIGGYTQAVRDGKMGLLNMQGEEVIPCQYDFVQMPSEGMAAVYNAKDKDGTYLDYYMGYWSLEENREVVAPNKYVTKYVGIEIMSTNGVFGGREKPAGDFQQIHDFMDGYALVITGNKVDGKISNESLYVTILDKSGKEVLPKSYRILENTLTHSNTRIYPQEGSYLTFIEQKYEPGYEKNSYGQRLIEMDYFATGLAGPAGVVIPAIYTSSGYVKMNDTVYMKGPADLWVYPEANLVLTDVPEVNGKLTPWGSIALDLKGNVIKGPVDGDISYDAKSKNIVIGNSIYTNTGKLVTTVGQKALTGADGSLEDYIYLRANGYAEGLDHDPWVTDASVVGIGGYDPTTHYLLKGDGTKLNLTQRMGWSRKVDYPNHVQRYSEASIGGLFWVLSNERKWGLLDITGKEILPFVYDEVDYGAWTKQEDAHAIVTQNGKKGLVSPTGKVLAEPIYDSISFRSFHGGAVMNKSATLKKDGKVGLADLATGKILIPVKYDGFTSDFKYFGQINPDGFAMGVCPMLQGDNVVFVDRNGAEVFRDKRAKVSTEEATNGLYNAPGGLMDNRGRIVVPAVDRADATIDYHASDVIYIKDGNVYRQKANYFPRNYAPKPYAPQKATAAPSATKLTVDGKNVAVDAYAIAGNNYMKLRDLATMVNGTGKSFEVSWDSAKGAINLVSGKGYTAVGGEMAKGDGQSKAAKRNTAKIYLNGGEVAMTAYTIGQSNYFKLRDVMQVFDVAVGYDSATKTATLTTGERYTLTGDALRYQQADLAAFEKAGGKLQADGTVEQVQRHDEPFVKLTNTPTKMEYTVGDPFDSTGFKAVYIDIYDRSTDISKEFTFDINGTKIQDGYQFPKAGKVQINCTYQGEVYNYFTVNVYEKVAEKEVPLTDGGSYYIKLMGKYVTAVNGQWLELRTEKPDTPFTVEYLKKDIETGHHIYRVNYGKHAVRTYGADKGAQLATGGWESAGSGGEWRIAKYSDFWTMRKEFNQTMLVNASGVSSKDGTKVVTWPYKGSAPDHAKLQFIPAN